MLAMDNDTVLELIRLYREHPWLWNTRHFLYKNKTKKKDSFIDIGGHLGISADEAEKKINILRTQYRRERRKRRNMCKLGAIHNCAEDVSTLKKWFAYDAMVFLNDAVDTSRRDTATNEADEINFSGIEVTDNDETIKEEIEDKSHDEAAEVTERLIQDGTQAAPVCKRQTKMASAKSKASKVDETSTLMQLLVSKASDRNDSIAFGEHVGFRLQKLSEYARAVAIHKMNDILFEADMGMYERNTFNIYPASNVHFHQHPPSNESSTSSHATSFEFNVAPRHQSPCRSVHDDVEVE